MSNQVSSTNVDIVTIVKENLQNQAMNSWENILDDLLATKWLLKRVQYTVFSEFFLVTRFLDHADKSIPGLEKDRGGSLSKEENHLH